MRCGQVGHVKDQTPTTLPNIMVCGKRGRLITDTAITAFLWIAASKPRGGVICVSWPAPARVCTAACPGLIRRRLDRRPHVLRTGFCGGL
jgi:hypothetical protein